MRYSVIAAVAAALFALAPLGASAGRGCCSYHGGEAHRCSSDGREICNDGTVSWSCLCNGQVDRSRQRQRYRDGGQYMDGGYYSRPAGRASLLPSEQERGYSPRRSGGTAALPSGRDGSYSRDEQSLPSQPCGSRGRASGFCYEGLGLVCADGSLDREHGCSYSDMRLPSDIIQNGSGWRYVLDRASGLSAQIDFPQLNFGSHYFLFSYSLGRSGTSWAMADLDTGEISREPDRVFGYSEGHSEPVGVPDRNGKFHSCRYEFRLISEPYSDVVTAERRLAGRPGMTACQMAASAWETSAGQGAMPSGTGSSFRKTLMTEASCSAARGAADTDAGFPHAARGAFRMRLCRGEMAGKIIIAPEIPPWRIAVPF